MRTILSTLVGITLLVGTFAVGASDVSAGSESLLRSTVVGIPQNMRGQLLRGVTGVGAAWKVTKGEARVDGEGSMGRLRVKVEGLVITGTGTARDGTTGTITDVVASLTCEGTNVVATTGSVPLSTAGNAKIDAPITLPATCVAPIILVRNAAGTQSWLATTGF